MTNTQSDSGAPAVPVVAGKKIIVIGAGIAGLAFVVSLRKIWPESAVFPAITIYERDSKETSIGREGYSLSIRGDRLSGGMQALHKMGILESLLKVSITGPAPPEDGRGGFAMWDTQWKRIVGFRPQTASDSELPVSAMRIARDVLRKGLVDAVCENATIQWATPCTRIEQLKDGKLQVHLSHGGVDECDFLIAADGAHSKIRQTFRPDDVLSFAGPVCISGTSRFPAGEVPEPVDRDWGAVLGGNGIGLFVSPIDSKSALWSLSYLADMPRERIKLPLSEEDSSDLLQEALDLGRVFTEPFQKMVRATDPSTLMVFNAMDKQPFPHTDSTPSVIFIGDSNHAMSPFAGNGANMALLDGWELAEQLCRSATLTAALATYDKSSMPRSQSAIRISHWSISMAHATGLKLFTYKLVLKIMGFMLRLTGKV
jgi:2-polyprenyl-6-methoxyphenol hydroxylase-like FAD-dependent oxidoreductase